LIVETYKDQVTLVEYEPDATQEGLQCPRIQECCIDFFPQFDGYGPLKFADEKARLDNFVIYLKDEFGRGMIEVIGPSRRQREQLMKRAVTTRSYLVKKRRFEAERIIIVDGGFNEISSTRLNRYSIGGVASQIYFMPLPDPKNIAPEEAYINSVEERRLIYFNTATRIAARSADRLSWRGALESNTQTMRRRLTKGLR
jgi:hypothetical protein